MFGYFFFCLQIFFHTIIDNINYLDEDDESFTSKTTKGRYSKNSKNSDNDIGTGNSKRSFSSFMTEYDNEMNGHESESEVFKDCSADDQATVRQCYQLIKEYLIAADVGDGSHRVAMGDFFSRIKKESWNEFIASYSKMDGFSCIVKTCELYEFRCNKYSKQCDYQDTRHKRRRRTRR